MTDIIILLCINVRNAVIQVSARNRSTRKTPFPPPPRDQQIFSQTETTMHRQVQLFTGYFETAATGVVHLAGTNGKGERRSQPAPDGGLSTRLYLHDE